MFFPIPGLSTIQWVAIAAVSCLAVGYVKGCTDGEKKYVALQAAVEAEGKAAIEDALEEEALRKALTDKRDRNHATEVNNLRSYIAERERRLLDDANASFVPVLPGSASVSKEACYDREAVDRAIRRFASGVQGLVGKGQGAVNDLICGQGWAEDQGLVK